MKKVVLTIGIFVGALTYVSAQNTAVASEKKATEAKACCKKGGAQAGVSCSKSAATAEVSADTKQESGTVTKSVAAPATNDKARREKSVQ